MPAPVFTPRPNQQSPIKIVTARTWYAPELAPLVFHYTKVAGALEGHNFVLDRKGPDNYVEFDGMKCWLRRIHFHAPGEHRVDGPAADLELHLVHEILEYPDDYPSAYLVIAVLISLPGEPPPMKEPLPLDPWLRLHLGGDERTPPTVDPAVYLPADRAYYRYEGSMTMPDYEEIATWAVLRDRIVFPAKAPLKLDPEASRLVQPLERRYVLRNFIVGGDM